MSGVESSYAWWRLAASVALSTVGGIGMWCLVVALPSIQQDLGITRADISFAYTMNTLGFFAGGITWGRLVDRRGIVLTATLSATGLATGFALAPLTSSLALFAATQVLIGFSAAATFAPLVADISHWFEKRRGIAVAIAASGNYLAGAVWPPIIQLLIHDHGWRTTYWTVGALCLVTMVPLALTLRRRPPQHHAAETAGTFAVAPHSARSLGLSPNALQAVLVVAGIGCCVAMSMPQVHIVAYCADLGYGVAQGATMLSLMLGFGIVSRIGSGWIADRVGGIKTLLLGSTLQCVALVFYLIDDSLNSLYLASALFGLFQGGIVPSYAIIVREYFPPKEAGFRIGLAVSSTLIGMALGGWMGGVLFDMTGSYRAAFINGIAWNVLNGAVAWWLLFRQNRRNVYA
ncbi:MAG: MFS transporter [Alphaproteobacteria bacterium RIFCSPHIGHO2_12_FULL_66_14]|jgi:MFS family permease|nr:MAG: MFS transporter [Alphaproteobacteria bacterium RIFCSPHIGHO2_12_FULL_66_14]